MQLPNGTLLRAGTYRIVRFIARGGFGCTYEAVHTMLGTRLAIKEFFPKSFCNRDSDTLHVSVGTHSQEALVARLKKKFIEEACSIARMTHDGIIKVSDVFEENGTAYYVMNYIDGKSLADIISERGALSEDEALRYILQVCDALDYVHSHNRLHLDIKPGNIMIDCEGKATLIDFGASKQYDEENGENTSTLMGKTPGYAPIEQMGNDVSRFKAATDIYSLGATLYKCLTAKTPLEATVLAQGEELDPLPDNVSTSTMKALAKAMELVAKNRPQTVSEFASMLKGGAKAKKKASEDTIIDDPTPATKPKQTPTTKPKQMPRQTPRQTPKQEPRQTPGPKVQTNLHTPNSTPNRESEPVRYPAADYTDPYYDPNNRSKKIKIAAVAIAAILVLWFLVRMCSNSGDGYEEPNTPVEVIEVPDIDVPAVSIVEEQNQGSTSDTDKNPEDTKPDKKYEDKNPERTSKEGLANGPVHSTQPSESSARKQQDAPVSNQSTSDNSTKQETQPAKEEPYDPESDKIWEMVEQKPQFPGGDAELYMFLGNNITYPAAAAEADVQGTVVVRFVVEKDGSIGPVTVVRGKHPALDAEAVRVTKMLPKFIPGRQNGKPARVYYTLPIRFKLT